MSLECEQDKAAIHFWNNFTKSIIRHFYAGDFTYQSGETGERIERYPECKGDTSLLEKVKKFYNS